MAKFVTIVCTDEHLNIGDVVHITVTPLGFFTPPKCTIRYEFGSHSGTIAENSTATTFTFRTPHTFYAEIPDAKYGVLSLYCDVYENGVLLSTPYTTVQINAVESISKPTISLPNVRAYDELSPYLTGNDKALIRYVSTALVRATVETHTYATLDYTLIKNGDGTAVWDNEGEFYEVGTNVFTVKAVDSRGFETSIKYTVPAELFVEYIKLTCHIDYTRPNTDGDMRLTCSGNYFNDTFGAVHNSIHVDYRYKADGGEFTPWESMTVSTDENTYNAVMDLTGLDYRKKYTFECRASDKVTTVVSIPLETYTMPLFHWNKDEFVFEVPVTFNKGTDGKTTEYGTWTPTLTESKAVSSYTTQRGWYMRVGNVVTVGFNIGASCVSGYNTTSLVISGLPFKPDVGAFGGGVMFGAYVPANFCFEAWAATTAGQITPRLQPCNNTTAGNLNIASTAYYPSGANTVTLGGTITYITAE